MATISAERLDDLISIWRQKAEHWAKSGLSNQQEQEIELAELNQKT